MRTVYDVAEQNLGSIFSMHQYMRDAAKWHNLLREIPKLPAEGKHAIQVGGRLDIASFQIYQTHMLEWVLLVYNGIHTMGTGDFNPNRQSAEFSLEPQEQKVYALTLPYESVQVLNENGDDVPTLQDPQGRTYADADGNGTNDLRITVHEQTSTVENTQLSGTIKGRIVYIQQEESNILGQGYEIIYPSKLDIENLLAEQEEISEEDEGFDRL